MQTAVPTPVPTAQSLISLPYAQRQQAIAALPADQQAQLQAQVATLQRQYNRDYMARSLVQQAVCPPQSGSGVTQNYAAGADLIFNFPTAGGAFVRALLVKLTLSVNPAVGTGAAYALNAGGALALIDRIRVGFNGTQHNFRPFILPFLEKMRGYLRNSSNTILAGSSVTDVQNLLLSGVPAVGAAVPTGAHTWDVVFRIPLNMHDMDPKGLLPSMGAGTQGIVEIVCAPNALGPDPILNAIGVTAGTGAAVTITGTVEVDTEYSDGSNMQGQNPLTLDLRGLPTIQMLEDEVLSPLTAGTVNSHKIATLLQHAIVLSVLVDGQQSTSFATLANIQALTLAKDAVLANKFFGFGPQFGNLAVVNFYERLRRRYGQDLGDDGVIPWVDAMTTNTVDPSNREGVALLNMTANGWTDVHHGYQVAAVGAVSGVTPRVVTHVISINPAGLGIQ